MNKRTILLVAILVLSAVFAVYAQTSMTVKTYIATSTASSDTTTITKRANYQGFDESTMNQIDLSSTTATVTVTITKEPTETVVAQRISETAIATSSAVGGVLQFWWDTANTALALQYEDATGTLHQILVDDSTADAAALALKANLAGGNAFTGDQNITGSEVNIGSTTDLGAFVLQLHGDAILQDTGASAIFRVKTASTTGYAMFQLLGDADSEAYIAKNGSAYTGGAGADALEIYNANAKPIVFYQGANEVFRLCADEGAVQFIAIATPTLATGIMYFDTADSHLYFSPDGATVVQLDN